MVCNLHHFNRRMAHLFPVRTPFRGSQHIHCIHLSTSIILHINRTLTILPTLHMALTVRERITGRAAARPG